MKKMKMKLFKTMVYTVCIAITASVFIPFEIFAASYGKTVDFTKYGNDTLAALQDVYDSTMYKIESENPENNLYNITTQDVYFEDGGERKALLTLTKKTVEAMTDATKPADQAYYDEYNDVNSGNFIAYNVKGGTELNIVSLRKKGFWQYAEQNGYNWQFTFYVSEDYKNWTAVTPSVETASCNYASEDDWNPFTLEDTYNVSIPENAKFIKIVFPLIRRMYSIFTYTCGYEVLGTIKTLSYTPASEKAPSPSKKLDFSNFAESTNAALYATYDNSGRLGDKALDKGQSFAFSSTDIYYTNGTKKALLTLSKTAVEILEKGGRPISGSLSSDYDSIDKHYFITYNIEGGTEFELNSLRKKGFWQYADAAGYNWRFKFYSSSDNSSWSEITPEISTADVNYASADGWNPFTLADNYKLTVPKDAKFIKICFPQVCSLQNVFTYTNGYDVYGTVSDITYTPAVNKAEPIINKSEPKRDYSDTLKFDAFSGNMASALKDITENMYDGSFDVLNLGDGNSNYLYKGTEALPLLTLKESAVRNKSGYEPYYIAYGVEPGTSVRVQTLHRERESAAMAAGGLNYKLKFYSSADGVNYTPLDTVFYKEEGFVTQSINNKYYSDMDTYVVDIPSGDCIVKIEFPQSTDISQAGLYFARSEAAGSNFGDWQIAAIKNISYTKPSVAPPRTVNFSMVSDFSKELSKTYGYSTKTSGTVKSDAEVFSVTDAKYTESGKTNYLLSLTDAALKNLSADDKFDGYYLIYNVDGNSPFALKAYIPSSKEKLLTDNGIDCDFKFFVSDDGKKWDAVSVTPSESQLSLSGVDLQRNYSFNTSKNSKFVKVVFPQMQSFESILGEKQYGNLVTALVKSITYTPAASAAELPAEPQYDYKEKLDFTEQDTDMPTLLYATKTDTPEAFSLSEAVCTASDIIYKPLCIAESAIKNKKALDEPFSLTFEVLPDTAFRLEGLRNYKNSAKITSRGLNCYFDFYISSDNKNWSEITDYYLSSKYYNSKEYDVLDTYIVKTSHDTKYLKIVFPNSQDCRYGTPDKISAVIASNIGNKEIGVIKSIAYSPKNPVKPEIKSDFNSMKSFMKGTQYMYDYSDKINSSEEKYADAGVFDVGEAWYQNADNTLTEKLLSLTFESLNALSDSEIDGYYITYNTEPGTLFKFTSYHQKSAENIMKNNGLDYKFKIFVSNDNINWSVLDADKLSFNSVAPEQGGNYDSLDFYSFVVPDGISFVKLVFPQVKNLRTEFGFGLGSPGNYQVGTIKSVEFTMAKNPAKPIRKVSDIKYKNKNDFTANYNKYLYIATNDMYSFTPGVLSMSQTWYTVQYDNGSGGTAQMDYPMLCLTFEALYDKESLDEPLYMTYNVEPDTDFRLESLRIYSTANKVAKLGRPVMFRFFESKDNITFTQCEAEIVTEYMNSMQFDTLDTYTVHTKPDTNFLKIVYPQQKDNGDAFGKGSPGNWQFATVRSVMYTAASNPAKRPAIKSDYNKDTDYSISELINKYGRYDFLKDIDPEIEISEDKKDSDDYSYDDGDDTPEKKTKKRKKVVVTKVIKKNKNGKNSTGLIIGVCAGGAVLIAAAILVVILIKKKKQKSR